MCNDYYQQQIRDDHSSKSVRQQLIPIKHQNSANLRLSVE